MEITDFDAVVDLMGEPPMPHQDRRIGIQKRPRVNVPVVVVVERESVYETIDESRMAEVMSYKDNSALCGDLRFITDSPEMCDVVFVVGREKVPVYGVKAILATRSRVFFAMMCTNQDSDSPAPKKSTKSRLLSRFRRLTKFTRAPRSRSLRQLVFRIVEFDPEPFRQVVTFLHCGAIHINQSNVIGVMNIADTYGLDDLRATCTQYARSCITLKRVLPLLVSAQRYSSFKWTKLVSLEVMDYITQNAQDLLRLRDFETLPHATTELILTKPNLRATEEAKWDAAVRWSRRHCERLDDTHFRASLRSLTISLNFCDMPVQKLRDVIQPLGIIPDDVINRAISYQSCPRLVIGQSEEPQRPNRQMGKQRGTVRLSTNAIGIHFPIQPLASSTFNSPESMNTSDSGYVLSSANCSLTSKL